jgi:hypothetical protein
MLGRFDEVAVHISILEAPIGDAVRSLWPHRGRGRSILRTEPVSSTLV